MPTIKEYDSPIDRLQPNTGGEEAYALMGRRVGQFYHQMGADVGGDISRLGNQYVEHQTDEEKRQVITSSVSLENNLHDSWTAFANAPENQGRNDLQSTFMSEVAGPQIDEWASHAQTREGKLLATERSAEIHDRLYQRTVADQSTMTAVHAAKQAQTTLQGLVGMTARDPSQADYVAGTIRNSVEALVPTTGIDPGTRVRTVEALQTAALTDNAESYYLGSTEAVRRDYAGGATTSPAEDQLRKDIAAGKFAPELGGDSFAKLSGAADEAKQRGLEEFKVRQSGNDRQLEIKYTAQATALETQISDAVAAGQPISPDMLTARDALVADPMAAGLVGPKIEQINGLIRDGVKAQADHTFTITDPHVSSDLLGRLTLPAGDPRAITEAELVNDVANHTLSKEDYGMYHQALPKIAADPQTKTDLKTMNSWIEGYKRDITGNGAYPGGATAFAQFKHDAMLQWMGWTRTEGAKAVDIMTNANNPRNFGRMVAEYTRAAQTNDPMGYLNTIPGYGQLSGAAQGSIVSPILGATPAGKGGPPPGPLDAKRLSDMDRVAGGH